MGDVAPSASDTTPPEEDPERIVVAKAVLIWARKTARLDEETASKRLGVSVENLLRLETGDVAPTLRQLRLAATAYGRPLAVLLLPEPPEDFDALRDFRAGHEARKGETSHALTVEYRRALMQREVILELADFGAVPSAPATPTFAIGLDHPAEDAGRLVRAWVGVDRTAWPEPRDALAGWIAATEAQGVLVMQTHRVKPEEVRGFSVSEWPHPVVALNGSEFTRGRLFTLAHELAHLGLNAGGLCDLHEERRSDDLEDRIEMYCNAVAAASLMPRDAVLGVPAIARATAGHAWSTDDLDSLARPFGISAESLLLRLVGLGKATWDLYRGLKPEFQRLYGEAKDRQRQSEGGPSYYVVKARDLGPGYIRTVLDAYRGRTITSFDVADYLDVRYDQIPRLEAAAG
jgi:Zn-dependent peptidase ImmA (M78 family)/transcriptional regulator with XRE-family HTH domain